MDRSQEEDNNKTKSIDIQTSNYGDNSQNELSMNRDEEEFFEQENQNFSQSGIQNNPEKVDQQQQYNSNLTESNLDIVNREDITLISGQTEKKNQLKAELLQYDNQLQYKHENYTNKNQIQNKQTIQQSHQHSNFINDPAFAISDKKVWAISGVMPGSVSKKFVRNYKLGRYKKVQSLKIDMEYLNSPHHQQLHLGNNIFPFQSNKNRILTTGSYDYSKYFQQQQADKFQQQRNPVQSTSAMKVTSRVNTGNINKGVQTQKSMTTFRSTNMKQQEDKRVFSPRTTTNTVIQQVLSQQNNYQNQQNPPPMHMEIRYIDIISQPIVKHSNFINNSKCPHGLTNQRLSERKNIFFFNQQNNRAQQTFENFKTPLSPKQMTQNPSTFTQYGQFKMAGDFTYHDTQDNLQEIVQKKQYKSNDFFGEYDIFDNEASNHYQSTNGLSKQNLIFQPKNVLLNSTHKNSKSHQQLSQFSTTDDNFFGKKSNKQSQKQPQNQLRLPLFASNPDNISFFPKAKQNLVKYVNEIGTQDNPLKNTFVSRKQLF